VHSVDHTALCEYRCLLSTCRFPIGDCQLSVPFTCRRCLGLAPPGLKVKGSSAARESKKELPGCLRRHCETCAVGYPDRVKQGSRKWGRRQA
jgi:hypothetical protein